MSVIDRSPLFEPFEVGSMKLANRIVMAPMTRNRCPGGIPGENVRDYYRRRAENGVSLIVTEGIGIDHGSALGEASLKETDMPVLHGEAALAGWADVVSAVHGAGGKIVPQLWHQGVMRLDGTGRDPGAPSMRPSGLWGPPGRDSACGPDYRAAVSAPTKAMTLQDIEDTIAAFVRSAVNAKRVGFDGIALHGAHGYLLDTFFWGETNQRTDRYGGDYIERTRFAAEVVSGIRAAVGPDFPIMLRFSQWKQQDFNARLVRTPQELEAWLAPLIDAGVDIFDVSTRVFDTPAFEGSDRSLAGWTRQVSGKPTAAVGSIGLGTDLYGGLLNSAPEDNINKVVRQLEQGEFDLVSVGRSLIADPAWVTRLRNVEPFLPYSMDRLAELH